MFKFLLLMALASYGCQRLTGRWPWQLWREMERRNLAEPEKRRARALLGVAKAASREDIIEAHKRLIARVHPDRGGLAELVHEANSARDLLLADMVRLEG